MTTAKSPDTRIAKEARRDLELAVSALEEHQALDVVVLDLRKISDMADFFVIATGSSDVHVRTLAESVLEAIKGAGRAPHHVEGVSAGRWALLDFVDVVIHLFHPTLRQYYQLERLWSDAPLVATGSSG